MNGFSISMRIEKFDLAEAIKSGEDFSFPGFSDSEWCCIVGVNIGHYSGAGQLHTEEIGRLLREAIQSQDGSYKRAVPSVIKSLPVWKYVEVWEKRNLASDEIFYERDGVLDDAAAAAGLAPLIKALRERDVYIVGPPSHRGLFFLKPKQFFEITTPNFHLEPGGIDRVVMDIQDFAMPGVYLFSCGMSDAVMISRLNGTIPGASFIDCGSIWDAFVGVGGHREWRQKLYDDPWRWVEWLRKNLV